MTFLRSEWLVLAWCGLALLPRGFAFAQAPVASAAALPAPLNRSVLSVGNDVYTAWDASALVCVQSAVDGSNVPPKFDWISGSGLGLGLAARNAQVRSSDVFALPEEVQRFLFQTLVWNESRKLNLFVPQEREVESAISEFRNLVRLGKCWIPGGGRAAAAFLESLPDARVRTLVDVALRAKAFERVRGDLRKNPNLLSQTWFWHSKLESEAK